jgi:hypothetical protein
MEINICAPLKEYCLEFDIDELCVNSYQISVDVESS